MSDQKTGSVEKTLEKEFDHSESNENKDTASLRRSSSASGGIGSILAILLALVAIGIASWPAYKIYKETQLVAQFDPILARILGIDAGLENLGNELLDVERRLAEKDAEMNARRTAHEAQMKQSLAEFSESLGAIESRMGTSSHDWVYAEVEYLVRMANQRVLMEQDANSALQLLQSADEIIRETDGLMAHRLREALAHDIVALKAVSSPDTQGIYLELSALVSQVPLLGRTLPAYQAPSSATDQSPAPSGFLVRILGLIRHAGTKIAHLVDFRRDESAIKPILPPKEEYFLRQNLVLKLQIAQMALLERNQSVFQSALGEAQIWVSGSFDGKNPGTVAMVKSIRRLSASQVAVDLPDIASSLKAARSQLAGFKGAQPK
jgi:uroporphyrin-3 C-methyltransferase